MEGRDGILARTTGTAGDEEWSVIWTCTGFFFILFFRLSPDPHISKILFFFLAGLCYYG